MIALASSRILELRARLWKGCRLFAKCPGRMGRCVAFSVPNLTSRSSDNLHPDIFYAGYNGDRMGLTSGTKLGQYEILSPLGAGAMGEVYRARDSRLNRDVAIKVLPGLSSEPDRLIRFEQEARATAALNHPNILAIFQMGTHVGVPYIVTELLEGKTLAESLRRGPLPPRKAIDYGVQIAQGLSAAHEKGIAHRDLKPENLFVTKEGRIKILDFGLAKIAPLKETPDALAPTVTRHGVAIGTVGYMSPEQVRGQATDHQSRPTCISRRTSGDCAWRCHSCSFLGTDSSRAQGLKLCSAYA